MMATIRIERGGGLVSDDVWRTPRQGYHASNGGGLRWEAWNGGGCVVTDKDTDPSCGQSKTPPGNVIVGSQPMAVLELQYIHYMALRYTTHCRGLCCVCPGAFPVVTPTVAPAIPTLAERGSCARRGAQSAGTVHAQQRQDFFILIAILPDPSIHPSIRPLHRHAPTLPKVPW